MDYFVYMLRCSDGRFYIGHTDNLEGRFTQHQKGNFKGYTYSRRPVELVWFESFQSRDHAFQIERKLKGWSRSKKQALIDGDWEQIKFLARNRQASLR